MALIYNIPSASIFIDTSTDLITVKTTTSSPVGTGSLITLSLNNNTAATSGNPQFSPALELVGAGYGSGSKTNKFAFQAQSVSGTWAGTGRSGDGYLGILPNFNGAGYSSSPSWLIDAFGNIQAKGFLTYGGSTTQVITVSPWIDVVFQNGWSNYGAPYHNTQYFKDINGVVHWRGAYKGPGGGGSSTVFQVPAGYTPSKIVDMCVTTSTSYNAFGGYQWAANGTQSGTNATTFILLDGMSYTAEQ